MLQIKFQVLSSSSSLVLQPTKGVLNRRMGRQIDGPKPLCPLNFFEVGHKNLAGNIIILSHFSQTQVQCTFSVFVYIHLFQILNFYYCVKDWKVGKHADVKKHMACACLVSSLLKKIKELNKYHTLGVVWNLLKRHLPLIPLGKNKMLIKIDVFLQFINKLIINT